MNRENAIDACEHVAGRLTNLSVTHGSSALAVHHRGCDLRFHATLSHAANAKTRNGAFSTGVLSIRPRC